MVALESKTWAVVGASRGLGHEFVTQLLTAGHRIVATVRSLPETTASLWPHHDGRCDVYDCDMLSEQSIDVNNQDFCRVLGGQVRLTFIGRPSPLSWLESTIASTL